MTAAPELTRYEKRVLALLGAANRPAGAYVIADRLSEPGRKVFAGTVYRCLARLERYGHVARSLCGQGFVAVPKGLREVPRLLVFCEACERVDCVAAPEPFHALTALAERHGFVPTRVHLDCSGTCAECRALPQDARSGLLTDELAR